MPDQDYWQDYESGPFCRHWSELDDCFRKCTFEGCGHGCESHYDGPRYNTEPDGCRECDCPCFLPVAKMYS